MARGRFSYESASHWLPRRFPPPGGLLVCQPVQVFAKPHPKGDPKTYRPTALYQARSLAHEKVKGRLQKRPET
jgi:hypothetical protein